MRRILLAHTAAAVYSIVSLLLVSLFMTSGCTAQTSTIQTSTIKNTCTKLEALVNDRNLPIFDASIQHPGAIPAAVLDSINDGYYEQSVKIAQLAQGTDIEVPFDDWARLSVVRSRHVDPSVPGNIRAGVSASSAEDAAIDACRTHGMEMGIIDSLSGLTSEG